MLSVCIYTDSIYAVKTVSPLSCSAIMDLKVVFAVVLLSALAITSTHAGIPRCCIKAKKFPVSLLLKAVRWERQYSTGECDLDALLVYIKNRRRPLCVDPKMVDILAIRKKRQKY